MPPNAIAIEKADMLYEGMKIIVNPYLAYFKNALGSTKKEPKDTYPLYDDIGGASSCSESDKFASLNISNIMGRCFDYNYEVEKIEWYDNPKLYKTGQSTVAGACWGEVHG